MHHTPFEFVGAEGTSGSRVLLEDLLLMGVGVANLDEMFLAARLVDRSVVESLDDLFADLPRLESVTTTGQRVVYKLDMDELPGEADTTAVTAWVTKNPG